MPKTVFVKTNGCQMNEYDAKKMSDVLRATSGIELTDDPEMADILLLNTCSVREKAQEKVYSELGRWRKIKKKRPHVIIGVGGCVASQEGEALVKQAPFVDIVFGPQTLHRLPELIAARKNQDKPVVDIRFPEIEKFDYLPEPRADGPTAYVTIMEGCSKYCSYCVVPYTRGTEINRPLDDILAEIVTLAEQGVREITLLGQNVNDYLGPKHDGGTADLAYLIHLIAAIEGIERIRFTTSHPAAFSERLIEAYALEPKLANHLHLPVQSGSDTILRAMKRNYTHAQYLEKLTALRKVRPTISISTDIIVGFPGETDADFQATLDLVAAVPFDFSFSFVYSPRPGTPAAMLVDNIPLAVKKERLKILQNKLNEQGQAMSTAMIGSKQRILVAGHAKKDKQQLSGRCENNRIVNFVGPKELYGQFIDITITEALANSLRGIYREPLNA